MRLCSWNLCVCGGLSWPLLCVFILIFYIANWGSTFLRVCGRILSPLQDADFDQICETRLPNKLTHNPIHDQKKSRLIRAQMDLFADASQPNKRPLRVHVDPDSSTVTPPTATSHSRCWFWSDLRDSTSEYSPPFKMRILIRFARLGFRINSPLHRTNMRVKFGQDDPICVSCSWTFTHSLQCHMQILRFPSWTFTHSSQMRP